MAEKTVQKLHGLLQDLHIAQSALPSASTYAKPLHWRYWQEQPTAILNLRPKKTRVFLFACWTPFSSVIRLAHILETRKGKIVHGDFRPANIMVRNTGEKDNLEVKVFDFDWAGPCGRAEYPITLNLEIDWLGRSGGFIGVVYLVEHLSDIPDQKKGLPALTRHRVGTTSMWSLH